MGKNVLFVAALVATIADSPTNAEMFGLGPWGDRSEAVRTIGDGADSCLKVHNSVRPWIDGFLTAVEFNDGIALSANASERLTKALKLECATKPERTINSAFTDLLVDYLNDVGEPLQSDTFYFPFGRWMDRSGGKIEAFGVGHSPCNIKGVGDGRKWQEGFLTAVMHHDGLELHT